MKRIRIIAAIAAVVTAIAVYAYLQSLKKPEQVVTAQVLVAAVEIQEGQQITQAMVAVKSLPEEAVVPGAIVNSGDAVGRFSASKVEPGEQLLASKVFDSGSGKSALAFALDPGMRAFTVPVDAVTGVAGLIQPRDTVDILLIIGLPQGSLTAQDAQVMVVHSTVLLQNIRVLAVDRVMQPNDSGPAADNPGTVTLAVTPDQAVELNLACSEGKIRLVLRSPRDTACPSVSPEEPGDLVK